MGDTCPNSDNNKPSIFFLKPHNKIQEPKLLSRTDLLWGLKATLKFKDFPWHGIKTHKKTQKHVTNSQVFVTESRIAASSAVDPSLEVLTATLQIQIFATGLDRCKLNSHQQLYDSERQIWYRYRNGIGEYFTISEDPSASWPKPHAQKSPTDSSTRYQVTGLSSSSAPKSYRTQSTCTISGNIVENIQLRVERLSNLWTRPVRRRRVEIGDLLRRKKRRI